MAPFTRSDAVATRKRGAMPTSHYQSALDECIGDLALVQTHPPRSALDLLAKNQGHIASGVLQQLLARNANFGAKLQTLQQVNEHTASHLGGGCASQAPCLHLPFETF